MCIYIYVMPWIDCSMRELNWFHRKELTWHGWHSPPTETSAIQLAEALSKQGTSLRKSFWQLGSTHLKSMFKIAQVNLGSQIISSCTKQFSTPIVTNPWNPWAICTRVTTNQTLKNKSKQQYQRFKLWQINPTTFDNFSSYAKFVSYKNHASWTVRNWRYANDVQYVRSKQVS